MIFNERCRVQEEQLEELNETAERNTELEARIGFMLSSHQVITDGYWHCVVVVRVIRWQLGWWCGEIDSTLCWCHALLTCSTSSSRERRQSSATEHSPSQVLWCGTVCKRQSEIPAPCQTSNLLWSLTCLLDYSQGCTNSYDLWRRPWIGFTCYGAIEIIVILLLFCQLYCVAV